MLDKFPNILNMIIRRLENFLRAFEKSFESQKKPFWSMALYLTNPILRVNFSKFKFFQRLLENFLSVVWSCLIYLETCLTSYLYARKKIRVIRHVKQIIRNEKYKSLDFWQIHSQNPVGIWFESTYFWGKIFFQRVLKNFLRVV